MLPKVKPVPPNGPTKKVMQTFRMPRELVTFLRGQADQGGRDLTFFVNRHLDGLRTWLGLPEAASTFLKADCEALGMPRYEYLLHILFRRTLEVREKGPAFDAPGAERAKK